MSRFSTQTAGVIFALLAYIQWGFAPFYFKSINAVPADEILLHRIVWSFVFLLVIVMVRKHWQNCRAVLKNRKYVGLLCISSLFLAANWFLFIWAINSNHLLDASLGYFINPLFSVALGMIFFAERLRLFQWLAVALALLGVAIQIIHFGAVPWIALGLAFTFGCYGLIRKKLPVDSITGLLLESLLLVPPALVYWWLYATSDYADLTANTLAMNLLLISACFVTTLPLLCFIAAAQRLRLSTLGFFQYVGPSIMFVLAVFIYDEAFSQEKLVTFACIWTALVIYSVDAIRFQHKAHRQRKAQTKLQENKAV